MSNDLNDTLRDIAGGEEEPNDRVYTVVAVYNGDLSHVSVWNTEQLAIEQAQKLRNEGLHFVDVDEHEIGT